MLRQYWVKAFCLMISLYLWAGLAMPVRAYRLPLKWKYPQLELNGQHQVSYNLSQVTGAKSIYDDNQFGGSNTLNNNSNLTVSGELIPDLKLFASFSASEFSQQNNTWNLFYNGSDVDVRLGLFSPSIGGNEFVTLGRSLRGVEMTGKIGSGTFSTLLSELKSTVHTEQFYGRNIRGPYSLSAWPIVPESEVVLLRDTQLKRGVDYTLDPNYGTLNFTEVITDADHITVSYELAANGLGGGQLYAVRANYPLGAFSIGVTHLGLAADVSPGGTERVTDRFRIYELPVIRFTLTKGPIVPQSEVATVNGILQVRDVAYTIDYATGEITFTNGHEPIPNTTLTVEYARTVEATGGRDRSVTGIDVGWAGAKGFSGKLHAASSNGGVPSSIPVKVITGETIDIRPTAIIPITQQVFRFAYYPIETSSDTVQLNAQMLLRDIDYTLNYQTGKMQILHNNLLLSPAGGDKFTVSYRTVARMVYAEGNSAIAITGAYSHSPLTTMLEYRTVAPGFNPLEQAGYRNARESLKWTAGYTLLDDSLHLFTDGESARLPYNAYSYDPFDNIEMNELTNNFNAEYIHPNWPMLSFRRSTRHSQQVGDDLLGDTSVNDNLQINWNGGPLTTNLSLNRTVSDSRQLIMSSSTGTAGDDSAQTVNSYSGVTQSATLNLGYYPRETPLSLSGNITVNNTKSAMADADLNTAGLNYDLNASYHIGDKFILSTFYNTSETGAGRDALGHEFDALTNTTFSFDTVWYALDQLTFNTRYQTYRYMGNDSGNYTTDTISANTNWNPREWLSCNAGWTTQLMRYLDSTGDSQLHSINLDVQAPIWKTTASLGVYRTVGNSAYQQSVVSSAGSIVTNVKTNTTSVNGSISYPITKRQAISLSSEITHNTGAPNIYWRQHYSLGWSYDLGQNLVFTASANREVYDDWDNYNNCYQSNGLGADLRVQF